MDNALGVRQYTPHGSRFPSESDANQAGKRPIPKFASFQPKLSDSPKDAENDTPGQAQQSDDPSAKSRHRKNHSRGQERNQHGTRRSDDRILPTRSELSKTSVRDLELRSNAFVVDSIGDPKILAFGALDRYATPAYSRFGVGSVIGSDLRYKIDRGASNEKCLIISSLNKHESQGQPPLRLSRQWQSREFRVKKQSKVDAAGDRTADFLPLGSNVLAKRKRGENSRSLSQSSSEDELDGYRSIHGRTSALRKPNDPDLAYASDSNHSPIPSAGSLDDHVQGKRIELTLRVDSDPGSAEAWMQLIQHQANFVGHKSTVAERRSNSEIQISMYEKALATVKSPKSRQDLLVGMMEEAARIWDSHKLLAQWKKILHANSSFLGLWKTYLDFKQTDFSPFRYEEVQSVFLDCLSTLKTTPNLRDFAGHDEKDEIQIFILLRMTLYMRESGFLEHALATWQSLLEFEFFQPPELKGHTDQSEDSFHSLKTSKFERYWDSEVPRIGEDAAEGWASFCVRSGRPSKSKTATAEQFGHADTLFSSWIMLERKNGLLSRQPARTIDDIPENDPYRVVLFSDIQPFLMTPSSLNGRHVLLEAFLVFCQLPPYRKDRKERSWGKEGFTRNDVLYVAREAKLPQSVSPDNENDIRDSLVQQGAPKPSPFEFSTPVYQIDSATTFSVQGSWFSAFEWWQKNKSTEKGPIEQTWVLRALKSLMMSDIGNDELAEYVLALELRVSPNTAKKTARGLLKKRTSSLRLYNAYALIEYRLGNASKGEGALVASINMARKLDGTMSRDCILLWRTWIWELLGEDRMHDALCRLQSYGDTIIGESPLEIQVEQPPNPARTLRAEGALTAFRDQMLLFQSYRHAALAMECLILLAYLRDPSDLTTATGALKANLRLLSLIFINDTSSLESLHQSFARLQFYHATHTHLFRPSDIRSFLSESIAQFPQNTLFLSLYAWNETRFRIDDRVRSIVRDVVLGAQPDFNSKESVVSHIFAIHSELKRGVALGSNANAIRATFERAVESRNGAHCAGVWKMFLLFEHSRGDLRKATEVFYRGIRACPWVKELYLLPFEYLRDGPGGMSKADLRGVHDLMVEKELRVHVDLEELIEQREEQTMSVEAHAATTE